MSLFSLIGKKKKPRVAATPEAGPLKATLEVAPETVAEAAVEAPPRKAPQRPKPSTAQFVWFCIAITFITGAAGVAVFFFTIRGAEQTMVPDVRGIELTQAMLELQAKELYPRLQLQYSQTQDDKGMVLSQDPPAGSIVKTGRRIRLVVSQGVIINSVDNYIGRNVDDVRLEVRTLFASSDTPLLTLVEPYTYQYSSEPMGVILEQSPEAGASLSGPTDLSLVVSLGQQFTSVETPQIVGLTPTEIGRAHV
jgi:beta-lactam-binding protein with PASTA domain